MLSEIGSNFWFNPNEGKKGSELGSPYQYGFQGSDYVWLSTGRSAIRMVLKTIEERNPQIKKIALLPPFTCHTVFEPFMEFGFDIDTLPISRDLTTKGEDIIRLQEETQASVLLVHRYYGFDTLPGFQKASDVLRSKGVVIIEDCTQNLYSTFERSNADYYVGSIRKWCGVPDGGFAICKEEFFAEKPNVQDKQMVDAKYQASEWKYNYLFNHKGDKSTFKAKYREAEDMLANQKGFYTIGEISASIQAELNIAFLKERRRNNYKTLLEGINGLSVIKPVFNKLSEDVTPLYFPVFVKNRVRVQNHLADNDIYAPVVWPKVENSPAVCENAKKIYDEILCIPIDQRYQEDDMNRIISVIKQINI